MDFTNAVFIGRLTIAAGIVAAIQITLLALMFTVATKPYGPLSDVAYALSPVLMLPLLFAFRHIYQADFSGGSQWAIVLGVLGAAIASINQVIFLLKIIDLKQSMVGYQVGLGLIGVALLLFAVFGRTNAEIPGGITIFGIVVGAAFTMSLFPGIFFLNDFYAMSTGTLDYSTMNPLMYLMLLAAAVSQIGLPVWLILLGRLFLNGRITIPVG